MNLNFLKLPSLFLSQRESVGLDIGSFCVKLVKLKKIKENFEFCAFDICDFKTEEELGNILRQIREDHKISRVNLGISSDSTIIRYITFPQMNPQELKESLKFEVAEYLPLPIEELVLDSYILKKGLADSKMLVLVAAVKKEFLENKLKLLSEVGIKVNLIDIDSLALINAFNFSYPKEELEKKCVALIDIGASLTTLNILEADTPVLTRTIHLGGSNLTKMLKEVLNLDLEAAEGLKRNPSDEKIAKVITLSQAVVSNLAAEIRSSFDYYESQGSLTVSRIFLSGGGSLCVGIKEALSKLLNIRVDYWQALGNIKIAPALEKAKVQDSLAQLTVAIGLALR